MRKINFHKKNKKLDEQKIAQIYAATQELILIRLQNVTYCTNAV